MLIHNLIKMKLIDEGYLPNYPYHLISDKEMCDAFIGRELSNDGIATYRLNGYFIDNYPIYHTEIISDNLTKSYENLVLSIYCHLQLYLLYKADNKVYEIPDWVYSYMLGAVISINSDKKDIHDLIYPLGVDNIDDDFNQESMVACNMVSMNWLRKANQLTPVALPSEYLSVFTNSSNNGLLDETDFLGGEVTPTKLIDVYSEFTDFYPYPETDPPPEQPLFTKPVNAYYIRPLTIFGEPHVIKAIRLSQIGG